MLTPENMVLTVGAAFVLSVIGILIGLLLLGIDRRISARMQARIGPPLLQPVIDLRKLLSKENIVPENAIPGIFNAAPIVALASSLVILLYLPIGSMVPILGGYGDLILVMYLLAVPALAMVAGGFASGSPYATVGAQREMVSMIAYELPLASAVIAIAWLLYSKGIANPFSLAVIAENPVWTLVGPLGMLGLLLLLLTLAWVTPAELSKIPFDSPEAETELAGGLLVEYSGKNLGLFTVAQGVKTLVMGGLAIAIFFPWNISPVLGLTSYAAFTADFIFFFLKVIVLMILSVTIIRTGIARFRINHVVTLFWVYLGLIGLAGLSLIILDSVFAGWF
ncbi:MAG: NADH-quinone oxidoreductase subunit H [Methanocalculus sp. MSAO_Arc1]|uniref:respiratory chain complex I subunit 1 family protein n=1 Tax=Methanocalculus TaxID=71151 RepID=UPI000FF755D2|nr:MULTISPECIES: complex I subunit 1 family protein [unclassified Methanocalculus]MCP1662798.1 formate hydrogenlyase subunit 4 [Methanocalculus sp. AMF5]RQD81061.1 MAG: NADH-quinone oxidoreductase subunit H [Methanocalculus sp. MSAO_Arc1]